MMQIASLPFSDVAKIPKRGSELSTVKPVLPKHWVSRERLHARLDEATRRDVTLITGPAGSGKSTLVAGWSKSCKNQEMLWVAAGGGIRSLTEVVSVADDKSGNDRQAPHLLVIDDIHLITDRTVAADLEGFIGNMPTKLKLVLVGRHCGAVSLAHLHLQTQVSEVTGDELEFTNDESEALFSAVDVHLGAEAIEMLLSETRGWAVGMRLASVLMTDIGDVKKVTSLLNSVHGPIWDYLETSVIPELQDEDVAALSRASLVEPLEGRFCEVFTGRPDAIQLLESLAARNLFVSKNQSASESFELHPVFSRYLRHRLEMKGHDAVLEARREADEWLKQRQGLNRPEVDDRTGEGPNSLEGRHLCPARMMEPLTCREQELAAYLPSHLTQSEIANKMFISENTVKTHMKALYRKLGATSRSEAVDIASSRGLLQAGVDPLIAGRRIRFTDSRRI